MVEKNCSEATTNSGEMLGSMKGRYPARRQVPNLTPWHHRSTFLSSMSLQLRYRSPPHTTPLPYLSTLGVFSAGSWATIGTEQCSEG